MQIFNKCNFFSAPYFLHYLVGADNYSFCKHVQLWHVSELWRVGRVEVTEQVTAAWCGRPGDVLWPSFSVRHSHVIFHISHIHQLLFLLSPTLMQCLNCRGRVTLPTFFLNSLNTLSYYAWGSAIYYIYRNYITILGFRDNSA